MRRAVFIACFTFRACGLGFVPVRFAISFMPLRINMRVTIRISLSTFIASILVFKHLRLLVVSVFVFTGGGVARWGTVFQ